MSDTTTQTVLHSERRGEVALNLRVDATLADRIDSYRHKHRHKSLKAAIVDLLTDALHADDGRELR